MYKKELRISKTDVKQVNIVSFSLLFLLFCIHISTNYSRLFTVYLVLLKLKTLYYEFDRSVYEYTLWNNIFVQKHVFATLVNSWILLKNPPNIFHDCFISKIPGKLLLKQKHEIFFFSMDCFKFSGIKGGSVGKMYATYVKLKATTRIHHCFFCVHGYWF